MYPSFLENKQGQLAAKATAEARVKADLQYDALCSSIILILESSRTALHRPHFITILIYLILGLGAAPLFI